MSKRDLVKQVSRNLNSRGGSGEVSPPSKPGHALETTSAAESPARAGASAQTAGASGKQAAFWLDDEDRAIFHEVGMHLYAQGIKPSNNLIVRAAIRMMPRDHRLVELIQELSAGDGRKIRHRIKNR